MTWLSGCRDETACVPVESTQKVRLRSPAVRDSTGKDVCPRAAWVLIVILTCFR
jgi:hypothetical protein